MSWGDLARFKKLFEWIAAIIALLPSVAILLGLVDMPPDLGTLITLIAFGVSFATILVVILASERIKALSTGKAIAIIVAAMLVGCVSAVMYRDYAAEHVVSIAHDEENVEHLIVPEDPSAELLALVGPFDMDYLEALQVHPERDKIRELMREEDLGATRWIILLLMLAQGLITGAIVFGVWKVASEMRDDDEGAPPPALPGG